MLFRNQAISRKIGVWARPLALLLVALLVLPFFAWAAPPSNITVKVYVFHDKNGNFDLDNQDVLTQLEGGLTLTLGVSDYAGTYVQNGGYYTFSVPAGSYKASTIKMKTLPQDYTCDTVTYRPNNESSLIIPPSTESVPLSGTTTLYFPLKLTTNPGRAEGRAIFNDDTSVAGPTVTISLKDDKTGIPQSLTVSNSNRARFDNVPLIPGNSYTLSASIPNGPPNYSVITSPYTFTALDGESYSFDFRVKRTAEVQIYFTTVTASSTTHDGFKTLYSNNAVEYGTDLTKPNLLEIPAQDGDQPGTYAVTGWYTDNAFTKEWNPLTERVSGNLTLYGKRVYSPQYHTVSFSFRGNIIGTAKVEHNKSFSTSLIPRITDSHYYANNWYTDSGYKTKFVFGQMTVTEDITLYGKPIADSSSSGSSGSSSSRGTTRRDTVAAPSFRSVTATLRGDQIILKVQMDSSLPVFDYRWQVKDSRDVWQDIPGSNKQTLTLDGPATGTTYEFRVIAMRDSDGATATSNVVSVIVPDDEMPTMETSTTLPPTSRPSGNSGGSSSTNAGNSYPTGSSSGYIGAQALTLSLSSNEFIFEGGRITVTPSISGGEWKWDEAMLDGSPDDKAVFTGLKSGIASITYTVDGQSATAEIDIQPAVLPATGQSLTAVYLLGGAGILLLLAAAAVIRWRKGDYHGTHQ